MDKQSLIVAICILGIALFVACSDNTTRQNDTTVPDTQVTTTSDAEDTTDTNPPPCTEEDNLCLGEIRRQWCQADGTLAAEDCPLNQVCFDGECSDVVCDAYRVDACEGFRYRGCNPRGTGEGVFDCPPGFTCSEEENDCVPKFCESGKIRCKEPEPGVGFADAFMVCNEAGTEFVDQGARCSDSDVKRVCEDNQCKSRCEALVKNASYIGCDYWAVDLDNIMEDPGNGSTAAGQIYAVVVSNATRDLTANVQVFDVNGYYLDPPQPLTTVQIPPRDLAVIPLPPDCYTRPICAAAYAVNNTTLTPAAFRIVADVPITAYQFNPLDNTTQVYSNDASLLFPETSLGVRYFVMAGGTKWLSSPSYFTVVGVGDQEVNVTVRPSVRTMPGRTSLGQEIPAINAGETRSFVLKPFDVLNISSGREDTYDALGNSIPTGDLTGSEIVADGRIAVFAGSECVEVPTTDPRTGACDHLEQQLFPVNNWGITYHAVKSWPRNDSRDMWRIMARTDGTIVTTSPDQLGSARTLNAGQWLSFLSTESFVVSANRPILVGQYLSGENDPQDRNLGVAAGIGDPAFILGVPIEQYRKDYIFLVPDAYAQDYISIIAPLETDITLDGTPITDEEIALRNGLIETLGESNFRSLRLAIADGTHTLIASQPVGLYVYGFDRYVSYGYPAGLNLGNLE